MTTILAIESSCDETGIGIAELADDGTVTLLADEVGLGKTIEACLLLREYLLRGLVRRILILVPAPLVSQWHEELESKFKLDFSIPPRTGSADRPEYWSETDRVLVSLAFAKNRKRAEFVAATPWDLVIVEEASS